MKFNGIDYAGKDQNDLHSTLRGIEIPSYAPITGNLGHRRVDYLTIDASELALGENHNISTTVSNITDDTSFQITEKIILSEIAQDRTSAWIRWSEANRIDTSLVEIDNNEIKISLPSGKLKLGLQQDESPQRFEKDREAPSTEQLLELVTLFGEDVEPYLDILGLKNTHIYDGKEYDYNRYWGACSEDSKIGAYSLHLNSRCASVVVAPSHHVYASFSMRD